MSFEDVLAEPDAARSIACVWKSAYKCFNLWLGLCYKISTVLCGKWIYQTDKYQGVKNFTLVARLGEKYFMQFSVATHELCMLHCVLLDCNGTKWTGNALSTPAAACSQQLLRRNKLPTGCFLFSFLVFSGHDMKVFVTDFIVDNVATHVQGFSSGILMIFFEKLG